MKPRGFVVECWTEEEQREYLFAFHRPAYLLLNAKSLIMSSRIDLNEVS